MSVDSKQKFLDYASNEQYLRGLLGGNVQADWRQALIARGFGWTVDVGTLTTPIVGGGNGTVLDLEQPELAINAPSGYALIPLRISVECQVGLQTTDSHESEIWIAFDKTQVQTAGTSTAETPVNMRTDLSGAPFTAFSAYTGDGVATPVLNTLARKQALTDVQSAVGVNVMQFDLVYEPLNPPFIIGPGNISVYYGGDIAVSGFIQAFVLCIPSTLLTTLS
jgi:hypothetical protein